ncbi:MAG: alpha/beta fold hydrolase [Candidatus Moranbacteria bacterium]|nr:alpha/beta fold hydrolase [Candidatus Moranbacteria bacterium]
MKLKLKTTIFLILLVFGVALFFSNHDRFFKKINDPNQAPKNQAETKIDNKREVQIEEKKEEPEAEKELRTMAIAKLRENQYPGGDFKIEETLPNGSNYKRLVASYQSEGLKIYGLLTVPLAPKPENGFPAVVFLHGYIPPERYSTINDYPTYQAALARAGFVTFKPDLRGHADSEGEPVSAHFSEKYVIDTLYAIAYLKNYEAVDSKRIGYWGHSNGGEIGLRTILVSDDLKAASFWAGVVGSYKDMFERHIDKIPFLKDRENPLIQKYGLPSQNKSFYQTIDPYYHLKDISIPIQLQHATGDKSVPIELSNHLNEELKKLNKEVEYFKYQGDDHNIAQNSSLAWQRTIEFFKENL